MEQAIRRMALSERITDETRRQVKESFPELNEMRWLSVKETFLSEAYRALATPCFVAGGNHHRIRQPRSAARPGDYRPGFEAMWHALHEADA